MLATIGEKTVDGLFDSIPDSLKLKRPFNLPGHLSEMELAREFGALAGRNQASAFESYLGAGAYEHYIPSVVKHLLGRSEFYTSYTPYQPEITQGMLQSIYEYQSMICLLTGMDVSNASLYEGGHALAESVLMACAATGRKKVVAAHGMHPEYLQVLRTYAHPQAIQVVEASDKVDLKGLVDEACAAIVFANPNFFGCVVDGKALAEIAHAKGALLVACVEPISLGLLACPGEFGADIACGEGQPLGIPLSFGGPWLGFIACKQALIRRMPGRLCGITKDNRGQRGFVLTLQTREQHIRREKATSNICTNQTLLALAATIYLSALGPQGLKEVAAACLEKAHYLGSRLSRVAGVGLSHTAPYFAEFTLKLPVDASALLEKMQAKGILAGVALSQFYPSRTKEILVSVTETKSKFQLDHFVEALMACLSEMKVSA
jgi:glycine dehydrogenase subunit 1